MEKEALIELQEHLEIFRKEFPLTRIVVFANCMTYRTGDGHSDKATNDANELIKKLSLPLIAIGTTTFKKDSFIVKAITNES